MEADSAFDDFWAASSLSALNRNAFFERIAGFDPRTPAVDPWSRPAAPTPGPRLTGPLADRLSGRRSGRRFGTRRIDSDQLSRLLSVLADTAEPADTAETDRARRGHPAAGGLYAVRSVALLFGAENAAGRVVQHDPRAHTLTDVGSCPDWAELIDDLGGGDAVTPPAAVIGLFADASAVLAKYGERGGRFLLLEAGAALQSLGLAAAELGLVGYPMGGGADERMLALAGLTGRGARYLVGYAVGHPDRSS